jgi:hypothetical protein
MSPKSDLPFGSEFSPSQIELGHVLELAKAHAGDPAALDDAIRATYFEARAISAYNKRKLAANTRLGLVAYGLLDGGTTTLTPLGERLYSLRADAQAISRELARHILLNLHGMTLVQCVKDLDAAGEPVTLVALGQRLRERGLYVPPGGKHASVMRLWLERAGVFRGGWRVDDQSLQELVGLPARGFEQLEKLTAQQRAYLRTLANLQAPGPHRSNEVARLASATYGVQFNEKSLPKDVLYPLQNAGYLTLERGTREPGRGARPFFVQPTDKLIAEVLDPLLRQLDAQVEPAVRALLRQPLAVVLHDIRHGDPHTRGLALEALAIRLMRLIDLRYVATRLRGAQTGGAEVDVLFDSDRLVFSRWQVQCKNTARISLDDVAKEVGLTHLLKSNVIVMISTGQIGQEARRYANRVMQDSNLCIVMIDDADVLTIEQHPTRIIEILHREARHAMTLKSLDTVHVMEAAQ